MFKLHGFKAGYNSKTSSLYLEKIQIGQEPMTFVLGPNGAGKSTLLRSLAGTLKPQAGQVLFNGTNVHEIEDPRYRPAYLPTRNQIQYGVTGEDLLSLFQIDTSEWYEDSTFAVLETHNHLPRPLQNLSSGEAQRVVLSAVLSHPSNFVLLDEPLNFLDVAFHFALQKIVFQQLCRGRSFIISTHDLNWALMFPKSRAIILSQAELLFDGPLESALTHPKVQEAFRFKSLLTDNPLTHDKLLALAPYEQD